MKLYGLKMHNFMRFGEVDNSIVFNVTKDKKEKIGKGELTFDKLYESLSNGPLKYIDDVNAIKDDNVLEGIVGIAGMTAGSFDSSNGSGKSTLFEAMAYLFYDRVVRQTANNDKKAIAGLSVVTKLAGVYPSNLKESYVEAYFEEDNSFYRLKRGRSFSKNKKSSTPVFEFDCIKEGEVDSLSSHRKRDTKKSLDQVIVEDYDIFVNTVMFGQADAGKFLTGTDKIKKDMIIELLKLEDIVHGCMDVIRERKKVENGKYNDFLSRSNSLKDLVLKDAAPFEQGEVEYSEELIDIISNRISQSLKKHQSNKEEAVSKLEDVNKKINELEGSEILKSIKLLVEEGKSLVQQKKDLEVKKDQDLSDWKKVIDKASSDLVKLKASKADRLNVQRQKEARLSKITNDIKGINRDEISKQESKCSSIIDLEEKCTSRLTLARQKREEVIAKISEFDAIINLRNKDLESLQKQVDNAGESENFLCTECHSIVTKDHTLKKINDIKVIIEENQTLKKSLLERSSKISEALSTIESRIRTISEKKVEMQSLKNKISLLDNGNAQIKDLNDEVIACKKDIEEKEESIKSSKDVFEEYSLKYNSVEEKYTNDFEVLNESIVEKRANVMALKEKSKGIEAEIATNEGLKETLKAEIAVIENRCGSNKQKISHIVSLGKKILEQDKDVAKAAKEVQRYKILESAFGLEGVQTRIVDKYLPLLNMYVKEFLDKLSDNKISVDFFVNKKSKIDMKVVGGTADNYVMLSGGEKMVVRLAVDIGLSLLSFSRTSKTPDMICLDEIFGPLDKDHTKSVFLMLEALKDRFKKVYLISHKSEIQSLVQNNIIVEKSSGNRGLSRIVGIRDVSVN